MKKEPLKVGERVRVFGMDMGPKGFADGAIKLPENEFGAVLVEVADGVVSAHPRQCVRLRRRERSEKRERVERTLHVSLGIEAWLPRDGDPPPPGKYRLVELRPGEVVLSRAELEKAWDKYVQTNGENRLVCNSELSRCFKKMAASLGLGEE